MFEENCSNTQLTSGNNKYITTTAVHPNFSINYAVSNHKPPVRKKHGTALLRSCPSACDNQNITDKDLLYFCQTDPLSGFFLACKDLGGWFNASFHACFFYIFFKRSAHTHTNSTL